MGSHELMAVCIVAVVAVSAVALTAVLRAGHRQDKLFTSLCEMFEMAVEHAMASSEDNRAVIAMHLDREAARATLEELRRASAGSTRIVRAPRAPKEPPPDVVVDFGPQSDSPA